MVVFGIDMVIALWLAVPDSRVHPAQSWAGVYGLDLPRTVHLKLARESRYRVASPASLVI